MTDNPISCPICFAHWDFKTDQIGRLIAVHPVTRCVPPMPFVLETEADEEGYPERNCDECHRLFKPSKNSPSQIVCGSKCRGVREYRRKKELAVPTREDVWELVKRQRKTA